MPSLPGRKLLRSHRPTRRTLLRQSRRWNQLDGIQNAFSGHAGDRLNPVDSRTLVPDSSAALLAQVEPS